jgi:hypothetical protein
MGVGRSGLRQVRSNALVIIDGGRPPATNSLEQQIVAGLH